MVGWSGGIENPFSSLFLMPMVLSILALPARWAWASAGASLAGYALTLLAGRELPHVHGLMGDTFSLHKVGLLVNFAVSALVVLVFFTRMAAARRDNEREIARLREQFARDEGILALATHAASVAHELNTPLGTLTLMVEDLATQAQSDAQREDYITLKALLEVCRDRVRELAAPAESGRHRWSRSGRGHRARHRALAAGATRRGSAAYRFGCGPAESGSGSGPSAAGTAQQCGGCRAAGGKHAHRPAPGNR